MKFQEFSQKLEGYRTISPELQDQQLEQGCLRLLSRLESKLEIIGRRSLAEDMNGTLEAGKELLVELLDFVTERFGDTSLSRDLTRICELRDAIRELQRMMNRSFWASLFGVESSHNEYRIQAYRSIGHRFCDVLRELLSVVDGHFRNPDLVTAWQSSSRALIEDFRQRW